jgi:hypothetical protein
VHAQAKDVELGSGDIDRYGFFGKAVGRPDPWDNGWWRYRVPGLGQVDWARVVDRLYEHGFTGTLSVEHEDPVWGGTDEKVVQGLRIAHRTLRPLVAPGDAAADVVALAERRAAEAAAAAGAAGPDRTAAPSAATLAAGADFRGVAPAVQSFSAGRRR